MPLKKILFPAMLIISLLAAPEARAELSLEEILKEASENNPDLAAMRERVKAMEARAKATGWLDDPTFKVEMEDLSRTQPLNIAPGNAMLTRYTLSQMFPFPGKLRLKEEMASRDASAARAALSGKELEIRSMVKEAYFEFAYLGEAINKVGEIKDLVTLMANSAEALYSTGQASQQDILKSNVEMTMLSNEIITMGAERDIAAARIKSLLNRPQETTLERPEGLLKARVRIDPEALARTAIETNPDVRMTEKEAEAGELGARLARKEYYPDFMVGVAPIQRDGRLDAYDLMFQINIPIWRGKYDGIAREASANALALKSRALSEKNLKALEAKSAALSALAAERMLTLYETSLLPQAELSFESAMKNYQTGRVDFLTLLDSERDLKRQRLEYLKTALDYRKKLAALEKAVGADLERARPMAAKENREAVNR